VVAREREVRKAVGKAGRPGKLVATRSFAEFTASFSSQMAEGIGGRARLRRTRAAVLARASVMASGGPGSGSVSRLKKDRSQVLIALIWATRGSRRATVKDFEPNWLGGGSSGKTSCETVQAARRSRARPPDDNELAGQRWR